MRPKALMVAPLPLLLQALRQGHLIGLELGGEVWVHVEWQIHGHFHMEQHDALLRFDER